MNLRAFDHPDVCLPVIQRRVTDEFLCLLLGVGELVLSRGRAWVYPSWFPNRMAFNAAACRLRKTGLIATRCRGGDTVWMLTDVGKARMPESLKATALWNRKWSGVWYLLAYDVPERQRSYREGLRGFLKRMRMGCLQRSVWVTPRDIRPEYDDLARAGGVLPFSFLFQARTVLGRSAQDVVQSAWDFDRLTDIQRRYSDVCAENLETILSDKADPRQLPSLARGEMRAYLGVMDEDPLLPRELWPPGYLGERVHRLHGDFVHEIGKHL